MAHCSSNSLKEVGHPHDMDNNHMLAIIEQRMCIDDRKVCSHHLERDCQQATLENLVAWMTTEMKSRMRATAPLWNRSQQQPKSTVGHIFSNKPSNPHNCWICQNSSHCVDQCSRFTSISPNDWLKAEKKKPCLLLLPGTCRKRPQGFYLLKKTTMLGKDKQKPVQVLPSTSQSLPLLRLSQTTRKPCCRSLK